MRAEKLNELKNVLSLMNDMVDDDLAIAVWDTKGELLLFLDPKTYPLHLDVGFIADKNDKIFTSMTTGNVVKNTLPREVFGVSVEGYIVPVYDEGEIVGCVTCVYSVEEREKLIESRELLRSTLTNSKEAIESIFNLATESVTYLSSMDQFIAHLQESMDEVRTSINSIRQNSRSTKILALNASIEAGRAREAGLGFNIVAKEMSRLSEASTSSVNEIEQALQAMANSMKDVLATLKNLNHTIDMDQVSTNELLDALNRNLTV